MLSWRSCSAVEARVPDIVRKPLGEIATFYPP
jgi:hypothetical protein